MHSSRNSNTSVQKFIISEKKYLLRRSILVSIVSSLKIIYLFFDLVQIKTPVEIAKLIGAMFRTGSSSCWLRPIINRKAIFEVSSASFSAQFVSASCCFINCHLMCSFADQIICNRGWRIHDPFRTKSMYPFSLYSLIFISNQSQRCHRLEQAMKI